MSPFLKLFWTSVVSIAGVIGLYIAADEADLLWAFWVVVGAGLLVAAVGRVGPRVIEDIVKLRNYPILLERSAKMQDEIEALKTSEAQAHEATEKGRLSGLIEGREQVRGALLGFNVSPPRLVAITELNGRVMLVGTSPDKVIPIFARFAVRVQQTGDLRGIVEVRQYDTNGNIYMGCVEPTVPTFWTKLADRVEYDASPPAAVELASYMLDIETGEALIGLSDAPEESWPEADQ